MRITHQEFSTNGVRVVDLDGVQGLSSHATHVAGTMGAYGVNSAAIGLAPRISILSSFFEEDLESIPEVVSTNHIPVSNHSYANQAGWGGALNVAGTVYPIWWGDTSISGTEDYSFGFYGEEAEAIDQTAYTAGSYLPVWAAGNERQTQAPPTQPTDHIAFVGEDAFIFTGVTRPEDAANHNGYDTLPGQAVAKNVLSVGAVSKISGGYGGSNTVVMSTFSSFGPADDGRIKPDIVAAGVSLFSTGIGSDTNYFIASGTSMAAPSVAGALGLLTELQMVQYGTNSPWRGSTLKALAIHSADEAGAAAGPDYRFGWGLMNALTAATLMTNNLAGTNIANSSLPHIKEVRLVSGDYIEFPVSAKGTEPLKVTIAWTDPAGVPVAPALNPADSMLINDLDLRLVRASTTNYPWRLNPANVTAAATTGDNTLDNVEQVIIQSPVAGVYTIQVTHKGDLVDDLDQIADQHVSIIISGNSADPIPPLAFNDVALTATNEVSLAWASVVGKTYQVLYRNNVDAGAWLPADGPISATKTNAAITLELSTALPTRFFQLVQLP